MTYSELAEIIDTFFTQNLILLTKQSEEESVAALRAYVEDSKALALQEQEILGSPTNTPMMRHKLRAQLLSRQSEMKSLTRILYWLDKCDYYPFHQSRLFKAIKQRIATLSLPVPKEIHFMSLIQLDAIQRDYIKLWAQQNARNYRINIWMDSATLLAGELCGRIQEAAVKHASTARHISDGAFQTQLTDWQNKAYKSIVHTMSQDDPNQIGSKFCFDQAAILFLEENGLAKPGELEKMGQTLADNFQLSVKELRKATPYASHIKLVDFYQMKDQTNYSLYIKELALRGNLLVATDISRLLILQQHGGIYLNTDILPRLNEMLFSPRIKIDRHNQEAVMQIVLDELVHRGQMPGRAEMINRIGRGGYLDQLQEMDDRVKQPIQHIVNQALDQHQDLFMPLGELKVDPYFACSYANGNNKAIIAIKNSPFINRVLNRLAQIHQVIIGENIDGLNPERPIPRTTNEEIRTVLQAKRLQLNDKWLLSYRSEGMITGGISSSRQIVGIAAYQHAYAALLEQAGVVLPDRRQQLSPHKILQPYTQAFFPTEEAYLSRSRESRIKFFYNVFPQSSQYDSQYIIQLQDDEGVNQMARFLYNKNSLRTAHYLYQPRTGRLVEINIAPNFAFKNRTRIILIAHGTFMKTLGGEQIVQLLVNQRLLRRDAQGLFPIIERVSIVACYITEPIPGSTNVVEKAGEPFIEKLYQAFSNKKITVNSISTREKVVSVDVLGRKWTGLPVNPQAPQHHWLIDWALVKESNRKIIFIQKNEGGIISKRITLVAGNNMRSSILRTSYDGRFGVDYVIDLPTEQVVKLNGYLDRKTAKSVIKNMQRGTLFMAADSMALIAGMTESQVNHGIIVNGTEHDMTAFQQILRLTEHHNDYRNWLTEIDLLGGTQALKSEMERLFDSPQTAFMRLKERYLHDDFDLFCLDLSNPMSAGIIERDMRGTAPIEGIYLSKIEQYLSPTIKLSIKRMDGPAERLNKLNGVIDKIEANLVYLNKGRDDTPLYYHSALTNRSEQTTVSQNELAKKYTHERYLYKAQEHYADTLIRNYFTLPIVLCDALVSANGELLAENNLPADKWAPLLLAMKYDKKTKKYVVPYLHDDGIQEKWLSTDNDQFAEMQRFLQQQHETLTEDYPLFNGRLYPGKTEIASIGANAVFAIMAIQHWLHNGITVPGNTLLAKTLQVHTYLAMTQVTFNVTGDTTTLLQAVFKSVRIGDFFRLFQLIALPVGLVLSIADVAFNAIELSKAENQVQRHLSRTQLTFSVAGLSLFVGGVIASLLGATLLIIGLFIVGIALAVAGYFSQAAILKAMKNLDKAKVIGGYFNAMRAGWEQGGFTLARGILQPCEGVVVTQVDLRNIHAISVVFDTMGQSIKKKDAVDGTSQNYIDLYPLREVGRTVNTTATPPDNATGITTLILPTQPRAKITPKSTLGFNAAPIHREFQAMHFFFRQNSAFPFSIASDPVSGLPYFSVPTALELYYFFTNVDIVLGNHHYHLIAPGVDETSPVNPLINQPVYSKHLHYTLLAPEQGAATVVLVLNNQQAPIIIDCVNDQVNWIIEARHLKGVEQIFYPAPVSTQASVVKFIRPTTSSEHSQQLISTITLKDSAKTKLTVRMPQGTVELDQQQSIFYHVNFSDLNNTHQTTDISDDQAVKLAVQNYLRVQKLRNNHAINQIQIDNYIHRDSRGGTEKIDGCFYHLKQATLFYTANHDDTPFNNSSTRSNVELIFHNSHCAWYRGDLTLALQQAQGNIEPTTYEKIFWMSDIRTKKLRYLYLPAVHLPITVNKERRANAATSDIIQTQVFAKGILFQQRYSYVVEGARKQIHFLYMIDTSSSEGHLTLLEIRDLPTGVVTDLINSSNLDALYHFMNKTTSVSSAGAKFSSLMPTHADIVKMGIRQSDATVLIGNRLIWPPLDSLGGVSGNISAKIDTSVLNDTRYLTTLTAAVKGDNPNNHHYFWSVTEPDNHQQFYKLYLQQGYSAAREIQLADFGLIDREVVGSSAAHQGIAISMKNGHAYHLTIDEQLTLQSLGKTCIENDQGGLASLTTSIRELKEKQGRPFSVESRQKKAIQIAPILVITDLLNCRRSVDDNDDENNRLSTWYDSIGEKLLICQANSYSQWQCLGMADQQGAWLVKHSHDSLEIGYLPTIPVDAKVTLFNGNRLRDSIEIPALQPLPADTLADSDSFTGVSLTDSGHLRVITQAGIMLEVIKKQHEFVTKLLGITRAFSDACYTFPHRPHRLNRGKMARTLSGLCAKYHCPEIIAIPLRDDRSGWYHPQTDGLFILPTDEGDAQYLGFSEDEQCAYFSAKRHGFLLQIFSPDDHDFIDNQQCIYQRLGELLILNANQTETPFYLNIDALPRLWITTNGQQRADKPFTFDIASFNYPVIEITHGGSGSVHCHTQVPRQGVSVTRKGAHLMVFFADNTLIINDVFDPQKNSAHHRLQLTFAARPITASELAAYYIESASHGDNGLVKPHEYAVIPLPD